jgi:hypothetical protein
MNTPETGPHHLGDGASGDPEAPGEVRVDDGRERVVLHPQDQSVLGDAGI